MRTSTIASIALALGLPATAAIAGPYYAPSKQIMAPPPPVVTEAFGEGLYFALHGGVNAYQEYDSSDHIHWEGHRVDIDGDESVGGYGGIKLGYGWGGDTVQPAIELDAFYNGADFDLDSSIGDRHLDHVNGRFDTGAVLGNAILRFNLDRLKPYVGAGAGIWFGEVDGEVLGIDHDGDLIVHTTDSESGFAWQVLAGVDYFINTQTSLFLEYKWLNYHEIDIPGADDRFGQHLFGAGVRWFF